MHSFWDPRSATNGCLVVGELLIVMSEYVNISETLLYVTAVALVGVGVPVMVSTYGSMSRDGFRRKLLERSISVENNDRVYRVRCVIGDRHIIFGWPMTVGAGYLIYESSALRFVGFTNRSELLDVTVPVSVIRVERMPRTLGLIQHLVFRIGNHVYYCSPDTGITRFGSKAAMKQILSGIGFEWSAKSA